MKKLTLLTLIWIFLLTACGGETPTPTVSNVDPEPAPATEPAAQSETDAAQTPAVEAIVYQIGDTMPYFDGTTLLYIPAGEFTMGVEDGEDNPIHTSSTEEFWIYSTEVTNAQYALCIETGACTPPDEEDNPFYLEPTVASLPVSGVTHQQAASYCSWVNGRLPSEAEWEKTARGPQADIYPWGDAAPTCNESNFADCEDGRVTNVITHPDGRSFYEAYDMAGNVFEWVADRYAEDAYLNGIPANAEERVMRGGSFRSSADELLAYQRFSALPDEHRDDLGFRCIVEDPAFFAPMCVQAATISDDVDMNEFYCPEVTSSASAFCENGVPYVSFKFATEEGFKFFSPGLQEGSLNAQQANKILKNNCSFFHDKEGSSASGYCAGPELASFSIRYTTACTYTGGDKEIKKINCGENYEYDEESDSCQYVGQDDVEEDASVECPQGFAYDTDTLCCTRVTEEEEAKPLCEPGYALDPQSQACYSVDKPLYTENDYLLLTFPSCSESGGGGEPNDDPEPSCKLTKDDCPAGVNETDCSCYPPPG